MLAFWGYRDRRGGQALRLQVPSEVTPGPGGLVGLELEFSVRSQRGCRVHFGSLIHRLALDGSALDPGDPNAYRCSWGGVITSDGAEAEIATPPVRTRPGFTAELQAWAETGESALRCAVPRGIELDGYSAHFSAAMPAKLNEPVCRLYAQTFAAALMLLMDRVYSPGLLVRPRPGRIELCGEFIEGESLPAVAAFVAGSTRACAAAVRKRSATVGLPPSLDVQLARAVHRYGWYVDRRAFGTDLHESWRRTLLRRASGGTISAQSHLELAWAAARQALADDAAASDMQTAEAMVAGSLPLRAEHNQPGPPINGRPDGGIPFVPGDRVPRKASQPRICERVRPGFALRPIVATWDFTVFEASSPARKAYACIPRSSLPGFIDRLEEGALDDAIAGYLALPSRRRILAAHQQTSRLGLYDQIDAPSGLLAPERDPQTGRYGSRQRGAKDQTSARPGKRTRHVDAVQRTRSRSLRKLFVIGAVLIVLLAVAGVAAAVLGRGGLQARVAFQPPALSFPNVLVNTSVTRTLTMTDTGSQPVTVTRISLAGPAGHDFSVRLQGNLSSDYHGGQVVQLATKPQPLCPQPLRTGESCNLRVTFTPSTPGPRIASLRVYFASHPQPQDIALTGTGITVNAALTLAPATLPAAVAGTPDKAQITATGGTAPYQFSITSGALPPRLSLNPATGVISGTPTTAGSYQFTITATDSSASHRTGARAYTLQITPAALTLAPATLPAAVAGTPDKAQITATGGTAPYQFSITSGALPPRLSLNPATGVISGTPTTAGSYQFTITATDSSPSHRTGARAYTLQITPAALTLAPATLPAAVAGTPDKAQITATGGTAPYQFSITSGALPPRLSLNPATGVISGTPTTAGSYQFTITATDSSPSHRTGARAYTLQITPAALTLAPATLPAAITTSSLIILKCSAQSYNGQITASGGTPPYRFSVTSGALPPGLSLNPTTGSISGTPTPESGDTSYSFTVSVTDSSPPPHTASQSYTISDDLCS